MHQQWDTVIDIEYCTLPRQLLRRQRRKRQAQVSHQQRRQSSQQLQHVKWQRQRLKRRHQRQKQRQIPRQPQQRRQRRHRRSQQLLLVSWRCTAAAGAATTWRHRAPCVATILCLRRCSAPLIDLHHRHRSPDRHNPTLNRQHSSKAASSTNDSLTTKSFWRRNSWQRCWLLFHRLRRRL